MSKFRRTFMIIEKSILPSGYKYVNYLESTGTQYINTGLYANPAKTKIEIECALPSFTKNKYCAFCGVFYGYSGAKRCMALGYEGGKVVGQFSFWQKSSMDAPTDRTQFTLVNNKLICNTTNTTLIDQGTGSNVTTATPIGIFAKSANDTLLWGETGVFIMRVWSFKIYYENNLISDMIPCQRISDGKPGMYDIVRNNFFINQRTGADFNIG